MQTESNESHQLIGNNKLLMIHFGDLLDILKSIPWAIKTMDPIQVLDENINFLIEWVGNELSYFEVVTKEDN